MQTDHGALKQMQAHWNELRAGRMVPLRSEIDPREIADTLETGFIVERTQPGMVRFRLAGLTLCDMMGMEVRGMPLRGLIQPSARANFNDQVERAFLGPETHEYVMVAQKSGGTTVSARMSLLPLRSDEGAINRAIGCLQVDGSLGLTPLRFDILETLCTNLRDGRVRREVPTRHRLRTPVTPERSAPRAFQPPELIPLDPDGKPILNVIRNDEVG